MTPEELKEHILAERAKGNVVFQALPGEFLSVSLEEFVKQPAEGMLYDLNRLEEVALSFLHEPKWVNDFAVALVIRKLVEQRDAALRSHPEASPEGWKLVPEKPTIEMLKAGQIRVNLQMGNHGMSGILSPQEACDVYERMLEASTPQMRQQGDHP